MFCKKCANKTVIITRGATISLPTTIADARQPKPALSKHYVYHLAGRREISPGRWMREIKTFREDAHHAIKQPLRALRALSSCASGMSSSRRSKWSRTEFGKQEETGRQRFMMQQHYIKIRYIAYGIVESIYEHTKENLQGD